MSSIDDVIARSQKPGEFTERREFSIARGQAIEKMRKFALVDPHYYMLELIQSAVANGATYMDIRCGDDHSALSYVGGHFEEASLAQLFDFLFAAEGDLEHGPLRQLALGVNALMRFEPDEIVIESGNGTRPGTTRVIIRGDEDVVEVGRPESSLDGTYLRAEGMRRRKMRRQSSLGEIDGKPPEYAAVVDRCLVAPVPILFNDDPVFGYSRQRTPKAPFGLKKTVSFDEGDLYGTIGVAARNSAASFRLLTYGVWIESTRHVFASTTGPDIANIGGIITFDRLRKTADHSAIVEDERYHEMWLRLRPYVNELVGGAAAGSAAENVTTMSGQELEDKELLELLRDSDTVVLYDPEVVEDDADYDSALRIGSSLEAPALCAPEEGRERIQLLGGGDVHFVLPDLDDAREINFYTQNEASLPARPWLTAPFDLGSASALDILDRLPRRHTLNRKSESGEELVDLSEMARRWIDDVERVKDLKPAQVVDVQWLLHWDPDRGDLSPLEEWIDAVARPEKIRATIYLPEQRQAERRNHNVEVRTANRTVWRGVSDAVAPGQILLIDVSEISPRRLWNSPRPLDTGETSAQLLAEAVARTHLTEIERAAEQGLRAALRTEFEPNTNAAKLVLSSLSHRIVKRIRRGSPRVRFSVIDFGLEERVLEIPLLKTISGRALSLRDLEELMEQCGGLLYAVRADEEAYLEDYDTDRIVLVDEVLERTLISLVGPGAYKRINGREVPAEYLRMQCREFAAGLCDHPEFPLLVEPIGELEDTFEERKQHVDGLVGELIERIKQRPLNPEAQRERRQAWRHLQWFVCHRGDFDFADDAGETVDELPLFLMGDGRTCSFADIRKVVEHRGHVEMLDGWTEGAMEREFESAVDHQIADVEPASFRLAMDPFVLHLLGDFARGAAEYHLSDRELDDLEDPDVDGESMLERKIIDNAEARGVVGVPMEPVERPAVVIFSDEERDAVLREDLGETFGIVGKIRLRGGVVHEEIEGKPVRVSRDVLSRLLSQLPELAESKDIDRYNRALEVLLKFASEQVSLFARSERTVDLELHDMLARAILNVPLFPSTEGTPISAMALYREFRDQASRALIKEKPLQFRSRLLGDEIPRALQEWMKRYLALDQIIAPPAYEESALPQSDDEQTAEQSIKESLEYWINELHPDTDNEGGRLHIFVDLNRDWFELKGRDDQFCQLIRDPGMLEHRGDVDDSLLLVNPDHWHTKWIQQEGDSSQRPLAWAVLTAYAQVNDLLERVTDRHELTCQQRVADALARGRFEMI